MVLIVVLASGTGYVIGRDDGDDSGCSTETLAVPVSDGSIYDDVCVPPMLDALEPMDTSVCGPGSRQSVLAGRVLPGWTSRRTTDVGISWRVVRCVTIRDVLPCSACSLSS
jgi:hypothetical protein